MRRFFAAVLTLSLAAMPQVGAAQGIEQIWQQANAAYDAGNYPEAEALWRRAIAIDPRNARAYNNLGIVLVEQGKIEEALSAYGNALERDGRNAYIYNNIGWALALQGKTKEAIDAYNLAGQYNSQLAAIYNNAADLLRKVGQVDDAIVAYQEALNLPNVEGVPADAHTLAHNGLGLALQQQGKLKDAIDEFEQALRLTPNYEPAKRNLAEAKRQLENGLPRVE